MKRLGIICALAVLGGLLAVAVAGASAIEFLLAEWLAAGAKIATAQASDMEGELEFHSSNGGNFKVSTRILCSRTLDGTVGPASAGVLTTLLNLSGTEISTTELSGSGLSCTNQENCTEPKVWMDGLPWNTELELMVDGTETFFVNLITSVAGFYFECLVLGITINELCSVAQTAVKTTNEAGGTVDTEFSDAFQVLAGLALESCTLGGGESSEWTGLTQTLLTSGTALTASSE